MAVPTGLMSQGLASNGSSQLPLKSNQPGLLQAAACRRRLHRQRLVQSSRIRAQEDSGEDQQGDDASLSEEFEFVKGKVDPTRKTKLAQHLNLIWSVSERKSSPETCDCCRGTGEIECLWCHGTGAMTVGDTLYCSESGCEKCPVCRGSGACKVSSHHESWHDASELPTGIAPDGPSREKEEEDELMIELKKLRLEIETQQEEWLLGAQDDHLKVLQKELEELRQGLQEDMASSGDSTPSTYTPPRRGLTVCQQSPHSSTSSFHLATPSPKRATTTHPSAVPTHRLAFSDANTSGETTPMTPCSPHASSPLGLSSKVAASFSRGTGTRCLPELAVTPPLPLGVHGKAPLPAATLEAALAAALESGGMSLDDWENEEEWLVKPASPTLMKGAEDIDIDTKPPPARPLPRVPKLNLPGLRAGGKSSSNGGGLSARNPPTISARAGIAGRQKTARGSSRQSDAGTTPPRSARLTPGHFKDHQQQSSASPPSLLAQGSKGRSNAPTPRLIRALDTGLKAHHARTPSQLSYTSESSGAGEGEAPMTARGSRIPKPRTSSKVVA